MNTPNNTSMVKTDKRALTRQEVQSTLKRLDRIATLMDDQFEIPVIKYRVGLDPIIGLIPGGGDWVVWGVSVMIFWQAYKLHVPMSLLLKMAANIGTDLLGGYVPGVGDVFDAAFKANKRNVELIHAHFGGAPQLGAELPVVLPQKSLERTRESQLLRFGAVVGLMLLLLAVASGPFILLYLFFTQ